MKKKVIGCIIGGLIICNIFAAGCGSKEEASKQAKKETSEAQQTQKKKDSKEEEFEQEESKYGNLKSFEAYTLDGNPFTQDDLAEKDVTVINFWSLSCGPCIAEMPDLAEYEKGLPDNVQVVTVCLDGQNAADIAGEVLQEAGFEGITLLAGDGDFTKVCRLIMYTPTTLFADKDGNIVGDEIIGRQENLEESYTDAVNEVLRSAGLAEIGNETKE